MTEQQLVKRLVEPFRALTIASQAHIAGTGTDATANALARTLYFKEKAALDAIRTRNLNVRVFYRLLTEQDNRIWREVTGK